MINPFLIRFNPRLILNDPNNVSKMNVCSNVQYDQVYMSDERFCKSLCIYGYVDMHT